MIYLDTHVVVWLYAGLTECLSPKAVDLIENNDLYISPMVMLELQYLREIERITAEPALMCENLASSIGLQICDRPFLRISENLDSCFGVIWTASGTQ
jgi:PIN domain nuclease of toxin-antitoxin system